MKTLLPIVAALLISSVSSGWAARPALEPRPSEYLLGPISRDPAEALKRGKEQHKAVWIIAWDEAFFRTAEGRFGSPAAYDLGYFYQNPETKKLVQNNFIQVFTTFKNPTIASWMNPADLTHVPVYFVVGPDGKVILRKSHMANPEDGLRAVQLAIAALEKYNATLAASTDKP